LSLTEIKAYKKQNTSLTNPIKNFQLALFQKKRANKIFLSKSDHTLQKLDKKTPKTSKK
jgi:hypothetical protein